MSKLILQINSLDALERLIGGDSQVEIDVRNSIVQAFAGKHLKAVASSPLIAEFTCKLTSQLERAIQIAAQEQIGTITGGFYNTMRIDMKPELTAHVINLAKATILETVRSSADAAIASFDTARLDVLVSQRIEVAINKIVDERVKAKIATLVAKL